MPLSPPLPSLLPAAEAQAAGAAGLVYLRVGEGGAVEAPKPVLEGLTPEQLAAVLQAAGAQPVSVRAPAAGQPLPRARLPELAGLCLAGLCLAGLCLSWLASA